MGALDQSNSKFKSIYRVSDAQPNWAQTDPSQPDYIKNRGLAQEVRPILVNGEEFLSNEVESGALNLVAGKNVMLATKDNTIIISSAGGGGGTGIAYIEGEGIDIVENEYGQFVINLEENAISDKHIGAISINKLVQDTTDILVLNGGNANG